MNHQELKQGTTTNFAQDTHLLTWIDAFLIDRKAQNVSKGTLYFYVKKLELFTRFCDGQGITQITQIDAGLIREFLLWLENNGHNPGGINALYRSLRAFLNWWQNEFEPEGWKNPIHKVKAPKVPLVPLEPVELDTVQLMLEKCAKGTFNGDRDRAILMTLLDTGARASELLSVDLADIDQVSGAVLIRQGKGRKPRSVFLGQKTRKAIRYYLRQRHDTNPALFITDELERLTYWGLRMVIARIAKRTGAKSPNLHSFRRAFALNCLRNGMDIYTLQKLMGHADLQVLRRYLKQTEGDLKDGHAKYSPVDRM
jgi:site-specific recombinase XerD